MLSLWQRLPILMRAVIAGFAVLAAGALPWTGIAGHALLAGWNASVLPNVPWAIPPMALYLWLFWRYLNGAGWPGTTSELRRTSLRANRLSGDIWGLSLFAGFIGLAALLPLLGIMSRLVKLLEEAAFRGYMQGPIERRHGPIAAILVNGTLFGLGHYTHHPASVFAMLPFYIAVAAVYGGLAYATNSILPGLVLHAGGDVFSLTRLWTTGRPEWQVSATPPGLIWETGPDGAFLGSVSVFVLLGAGATWAYYELARAARPVRVTS